MRDASGRIIRYVRQRTPAAANVNRPLRQQAIYGQPHRRATTNSQRRRRATHNGQSRRHTNQPRAVEAVNRPRLDGMSQPRIVLRNLSKRDISRINAALREYTNVFFSLF